MDGAGFEIANQKLVLRASRGLTVANGAFCRTELSARPSIFEWLDLF